MRCPGPPQGGQQSGTGIPPSAFTVVVMVVGFGAAAAEDRPTRAITGKIDIKRRFFMGRASFSYWNPTTARSITPCVESGYKFLGHVLELFTLN